MSVALIMSYGFFSTKTYSRQLRRRSLAMIHADHDVRGWIVVPHSERSAHNRAASWGERDTMSLLRTIVAACFWLFAGYAAAQERIALVIGNGAYRAPGWQLTNPPRDAALIAERLRALGFSVQLVTDADRRAMETAFQRYGERLKAAGPSTVGLFFYAGHGAQADGINYLIPIDADAQTADRLRYQSPALQFLFDDMAETGNAVNLIVLDACRNMPLPAGMRSVGRGGLADVGRLPNMFIAYAAAPGRVAADGEGRNSPFSHRARRGACFAYGRPDRACVLRRAGECLPGDRRGPVAGIPQRPRARAALASAGRRNARGRAARPASEPARAQRRRNARRRATRPASKPARAQSPRRLWRGRRRRLRRRRLGARRGHRLGFQQRQERAHAQQRDGRRPRPRRVRRQ